MSHSWLSLETFSGLRRITYQAVKLLLCWGNFKVNYVLSSRRGKKRFSFFCNYTSLLFLCKIVENRETV